MKLVINTCFGGFGLSDEALEAILERKGITFFRRKGRFFGADYYRCEPEEYDRIYEECREKKNFEEANGLYISPYDFERWDPDLVAVVEELGERAAGDHASLLVVDVPLEEDEFFIDDYDGVETVHENHRTWG